MLEEIDLSLWVSQAPADKRNFREAVHIILTAIGTSTALRPTMVMKGGLLLAKRDGTARLKLAAPRVRHGTVTAYVGTDAQCLMAWTTSRSVIVVLSLMSDGRHHDLAFTDDMEQGNVARGTEWNDEFSLQSIVEGNSTGERIGLQDAELASDSQQCAIR